MRYRRPSRAGQLGRWTAAILLIAATPVLAYVAWRTHESAKVTAAWPTTMAVINRVELREVATSRWAADVAYVYHVDGREYAGTRIRASDPYHRHRAAKASIAELAVGQRRAVYYNPANPAQSLLIPGAASGEAWLWILPPISLLGGTAVLRWLLANRGRRRVHLEEYV